MHSNDIWPRRFKPMSAYNKTWTFNEITRWPMWVSEKLDGIRFLANGMYIYSKQLKLIPNKYLQIELPARLEHGVEGELIIPGADFHTIQSVVMSEHHEREKEVQFKLFDWWNKPSLSYESRYMTLPVANRVHQTSTNKLALEGFAEFYGLSEKEGYIIRSPSARYKSGRCTLREQNMFKYVEWVRDEGVCEAVTGNTQHDDRIGGLSLSTKKFGEVVVGSGFTLEQSRQWRKDTSSIKYKTITFKYKPFGMKDKPRQPIFVGVRYDN